MKTCKHCGSILPLSEFYKHNAVKRALEKGILLKSETCTWCGANNMRIEAHHEDYKRPLNVIWLCSTCHKRLHLGQGEEAQHMREKIKIPF